VLALAEAIRRAVFTFFESGQPTDGLTCVAIKVEQKQRARSHSVNGQVQLLDRITLTRENDGFSIFAV
jgi:hypothetical protein